MSGVGEGAFRGPGDLEPLGDESDQLVTLTGDRTWRTTGSSTTTAGTDGHGGRGGQGGKKKSWGRPAATTRGCDQLVTVGDLRKRRGPKRGRTGPLVTGPVGLEAGTGRPLGGAVTDDQLVVEDLS